MSTNFFYLRLFDSWCLIKTFFVDIKSTKMLKKSLIQVKIFWNFAMLTPSCRTTWDLTRLEIVWKISNYGGGIAQWTVSIPEINFGNSNQKVRKSIYHSFLVLSNFTAFLYFVPNILCVTVWANKCLVIMRLRFLQTSIFWHFLKLTSFSPICNKNIK